MSLLLSLILSFDILLLHHTQTSQISGGKDQMTPMGVDQDHQSWLMEPWLGAGEFETMIVSLIVTLMYEL